MSINIAEIIGKRLLSDQAVKMWHKYPPEYADDGVIAHYRTLPAGRPSPLINSFIEVGDGYYQVDRGGYSTEGRSPGDFYISANAPVSIVDEDAGDDSSIFSSIWWFLVDGNRSFDDKQDRYEENVSDAFYDSVDTVGTDLKNMVGDVFKVVLIIAGLLVVFKFYDIID